MRWGRKIQKITHAFANFTPPPPLQKKKKEKKEYQNETIAWQSHAKD